MPSRRAQGEDCQAIVEQREEPAQCPADGSVQPNPIDVTAARDAASSLMLKAPPSAPELVPVPMTLGTLRPSRRVQRRRREATPELHESRRRARPTGGEADRIDVTAARDDATRLMLAHSIAPAKPTRMSKGRAKLAMAPGISVWVLEAPDGFGEAEFHAHHAIQITACLAGELTLSTATQSLSAPAIAVAADARHQFEASGLLAFIFVEPESRLGRGLLHRLFEGRELAEITNANFSEALEPLRTTFDVGLSRDRMLTAGHAAIHALAPATEAAVPDPRIQRIIDFAAANLDRPLSLAEASDGVYLSPSRLRHLFVEHTGLAFKTYILWLRLVRAVSLYAEGASLTEAAHEAGFSDSAHFSRIFKRTFGLPATTLTRL